MKFLSNWIDTGEALEQTIELPSFREAIALVNRIADLAEEANHHPDLTVSYRKVTVRWTTHSAGGVTDRDREMAAKTDELL